MINRRQFLEWLSAASAGLTLSAPSLARERGPATAGATFTQPTSPKARVIVVGGGMAGAAAAKFLRMWGDQLDITLVEKSARYTTCILSNLVLTGQRSLSQHEFTYTALRDRYGIRVIADEVAGLDPVNHTVRLAGGSTLAADRIVLAPGIAFDVIPGLESAAAQARVPHAWEAGPQTIALRDRLRAMPAGGVFAITIPKVPFRCPTGPYERATLVADYFKRNKPGARVLVLDANPDIVSERTMFSNAFNFTHAGVIEYHSNVTLNSIDANAGLLRTSIGNLQAQVINAIPPHRAGRLVAASGLNSVDGRWAGVNVLSYESTVAPGIHVIGDASGSSQPKAGHMANQQGKVCAQAVADLLQGSAVDPAPVTSSACFSTITMRTASWLTAVFGYDPASRTMKLLPNGIGESSRATSDDFEDMFKWYRSLMADSFA